MNRELMSTIVALSTPRGRGALAVIRLSGPDAIAIAKKMSGLDEVDPRHATLTKLISHDQILDQVLLTCFPAPHSLTGEAVVEISCHGSPAVVRSIVDATLALGAVLAGPGEFTLRALTNGKINLAQAEAIRDLIAAQTDAAVQQASRQLNGELSSALGPFKEKLVEAIVLLESALEFVEDDIPAPRANEIDRDLAAIAAGVQKLKRSYSAGRLLQEGIKVAITGRPNVGKSSVFNRLVERERAIVTDIPGTTRDTLSEAIDLEGIPVILTDTAGLRDTDDPVEALGVSRSRAAVKQADAIWLVFEAHVGKTEEDLALAEQIGDRLIWVANKSDLGEFEGEALAASAVSEGGTDILMGWIVRQFETTYETPLANERHAPDLEACRKAIYRANETLTNASVPVDLACVDLYDALDRIGRITGRTAPDEVIQRVFADFCIGK